MKITIYLQLDAYRLKKAINLNATTAGAGGMDGMLAFTALGNPPGSNAMQALGAASVPPGSDVETLVMLPWLQAPTAAGGVGLSAAAAASTLAILHAAAAQLSV